MRPFQLILLQRTQHFVFKQLKLQRLAVADHWPCPCLSVGASFVFPLTLTVVNSNHTVIWLIEYRVSFQAKDFCKF
jgi:hypothetical protein